jgi:hypothetical protein
MASGWDLTLAENCRRPQAASRVTAVIAEAMAAAETAPCLRCRVAPKAPLGRSSVWPDRRSSGLPGPVTT